MARSTYIWLMTAAVSLSACSPEMDMHGTNPQEYYRANPIQNKIEPRNWSQTVRFERNCKRISESDLAAMRIGLLDVSPAAVEAIQVQVNRTQMRNKPFRQEIVRVLRQMGYSRSDVMFEPSDTLEQEEIKLDVSYVAVVTPRCPDWRTSPVTTYSNGSQGNFGCANTVNLGLMVEDPRDLQQGSGSIMYNTERTAKVIQDYRGGKDFGGDSESGSGGAADSAAAATAAAVPAQ